jgi:hypothetical protein
MRPNAVSNLSSVNLATTNGNTIPVAFVSFVSAQAVSTGTPTGNVKLQVSNDLASSLSVDAYGQPIPVNWTDVPNSSTSISSSGSVLIPCTQICNQWLRSVFTDTAIGVQTVAPIADTGIIQHQTVTTVADSPSGALNSTYFTLSSINLVTKTQKNFYLWLDDGSGVDPAIAGKTGIHVTYTVLDTANTIATNIRAALNALTNDFVASGSAAAVIITNVAQGPVPAAADGTAATTFTFGARTVGVVSNLNNTYFLLQDEGSVHKYYVWMNVGAIGTDPLIAGRTGVEIDFSPGASAGTIGGDIATAVAALNGTSSFTTSGSTTVTITNKVAGPFVPMSDGAVPTGFTFAATVPTGSTIVNINTQGY